MAVCLQKLAARCERKMCAARLAIAAAEERELAVRNHLPLAVSCPYSYPHYTCKTSDTVTYYMKYS